MPTLFEHAGGEDALHRLEQTFYDSVLRDPLLQPLFGAGQPQHVEHLTMFTAESFGGPDRFTRELGFAHLIDVHRGLAITEEQAELDVLDDAGMPDAQPAAGSTALDVGRRRLTAAPIGRLADTGAYHSRAWGSSSRSSSRSSAERWPRTSARVT
jgi:truncated hemoglobin YjbI